MKNLRTVLDNFRTLIIFLLLALLSTLIFGSIYVAGNQILRSLADDPQVEVVEQVANLMKQDIPLEAILGQAEQIDISENNGLFVMIFDKDKKLVGSSAVIGEETPQLPTESFDTANASTGNRFTWKPKEGIRSAVVLKQIGDKGYAAAGKSLKETDYRTRNMATAIVLAWTLSLLTSLALSSALRPRRPIAIIEETNVTVIEENPEQEIV